MPNSNSSLDVALNTKEAGVEVVDKISLISILEIFHFTFFKLCFLKYEFTQN